MLLLTLSTLESLIIFIIGALAFFFLGKYFGGRSFTSLHATHNDLVGEHQNLQKQYKSIQKGVTQADQDRDQAKGKLQALAIEFETYKANDRDSKSRFSALQNEVVTLRSNNEKSKQTIEELHQRLNAANDKFRDNQKDTKAWRNEIDELNRSLKDYQQKLKSSHSTSAQLKAKLAAIGDVNEQLIQHKADLKANAKEIKRLTKDCAYWEKQHYDAHHKLASSLDSIEELKGTIQQANAEKQGLQAKEAAMQNTLDDFKKKLIYANERYHNMSQQHIQN